MDSVDDELAQRRVRAMVHERLFGAAAPPQIIGRYRVIRRLGVGAMGIVYAARDQELGRLVALKVLHGHLDGEGREARARLVREARALARVSHPNVVAVHEVGTHEGQVFVAMEYVAGQTLGAWVRDAKPHWRTIVQVFVAAGRGLQAAHAAGLVHRDFKPDNVLVDRTGRPRVLDFGLVRPEAGRVAPITGGGDELGPLTRSGAIVGTPAYMSPEQLRGEPLDPRSDLFSFCVALHEALLGGRPFDLFHEAGLRDVALGTRAEGVAPRLPRRLRRALDRGLERDRERRPPTMEPLLRELEAAATPAFQRWEPRVAGALGVVALAALVGVGARADGAAQRGAVVPRVAHLRLVGEHARVRSGDAPGSGPEARDRRRIAVAERLLADDPSAAAVVLAGVEGPREVTVRPVLERLVDTLLGEPLADAERWVAPGAKVGLTGDRFAYVLEDRSVRRLDLRAPAGEAATLLRSRAVALAIADDAAYIARDDGAVERWGHGDAAGERCASPGPAIVDLQAQGGGAAWLRADGSVSVDEPGGARLVTTVVGAESLAIGPSGRSLAIRRDHRVEVLGGRATIRIEHAGVDRHAIADSGWVATAAADGGVRIWSAAGKRVATITFDRPITHLAWSRGDHLAITAGERLVVWTPERGERPLRGLQGPIQAITWGDGDTLIASGDDGVVRRWSVDHGRVDGTLRGPSAIVGLAVDDRGEVIVTRDVDGAIRRWPLDGGGAAIVSRRPREVAALAVHPAGPRRASAGADAWIEVWSGDAEPEGRPPDHAIRCRAGVQALALGPTWIVGGEVSGRLCARRFTAAGEVIAATIDEAVTNRPITALAIDDAERWLAIGDSDGGVRLLDLHAPHPRPRRWLAARSGGPWVMSLSFETGSDRLLAATADGALALGSAAAQGARLDVGEYGPGLRVAVWGPPGVAIVAGEDGWIRAITADGRGPGARLGHHPAAIWDLAVGPISRGEGSGGGPTWIASAGADGAILLWPSETGARGMSLRGHRGEVLALARDVDDGYLLSAGQDGTVRRWPLGLEARLERLVDAVHVCLPSAIVEELAVAGEDASRCLDRPR